MMKRPWIKMCGFTQVSDVREAVRAGADLIGLNFCAESPRAVSFALANRLSEMARHEGAGRQGSRPVRCVAVFVDPPEELVHNVMEKVAPDVLQFHGDETPAFCQGFQRPFLKALRLRSSADCEAIATYHGGYAIGHLVDAWSPVAHGGTGRRLSLETASAGLAHPKGFLAGGLSPANVGELVRTLEPFGVDVASGIETRPGCKDAGKMAAFVRAVEDACRS